MIKLATGTASCIGQGNIDSLLGAVACAFITRPIDVILSEAKNLGFNCGGSLNMTVPVSPRGLVLAGNHIFTDARRVRVGEIRRILVGLIEHFSSAAGISAVLLDQSRDQPNIFVR